MSKLIQLENRVRDRMRKVIEFQVVGTAAATAANYPENLFIAPFPCRIESVVASFTAASTSGTLQINKAPSGTALASGTACLSAVISLAGTADTNVVGAVSATNGVLATGDRIGAIAAGTLTNQTGVGVTIVLVAL